MDPFSNLSEDHDSQIRKYIRFFRQKKDEILRSVVSEIDDAKEDRLNEDMFTKDDMIDFSDYISSVVKTSVTKEMSDIVNMNALIISKILENAQGNGLTIDLEIREAENNSLLQSIEKMNLDSMPRSKKATKLATMPSTLKNEAKLMKDEVDRVTSSNQVLSERFAAVQSEATRVSKENTLLKNEIDELNRHIAELSESSSKAGDDSKSDRVQELEEEIDRLKSEAAKHISASKQFQDLRGMMKKKSEMVVKLRRRLEKYEPEGSSKQDDADAEADEDDEDG